MVSAVTGRSSCREELHIWLFLVNALEQALENSKAIGKQHKCWGLLNLCICYVSKLHVQWNHSAIFSKPTEMESMKTKKLPFLKITVDKNA